ncbi:MAG: hypothetical protein AAF939_10775 [Planctomycetota bacterium]
MKHYLSGDEVMREVKVQQARLINDQHRPDTDCNCPDRQRPGDFKRIHKPSLQTIRGLIEISEPFEQRELELEHAIVMLADSVSNNFSDEPVVVLLVRPGY